MLSERFAFDVMNNVTGDTIVLKNFGIRIRDVIGSLMRLAVGRVNGEPMFAYSAN